MPFFNRYYLSTPLFNFQQIEVKIDDFNSISDSEEICLEVGKTSLLILGLRKADKKINYY